MRQLNQSKDSPVTKASIKATDAADSSAGPSWAAIRMERAWIEFCNVYERITVESLYQVDALETDMSTDQEPSRQEGNKKVQDCWALGCHP